MSDKTQLVTDAPAGAALIAQAMDRREGAGRYKAMQSIMDWDRSRLAYRAVKRAFDIVFSGAVLVFIAIPSLVLAAAIRLESEGTIPTDYSGNALILITDIPESGRVSMLSLQQA